MSPLKARPGSSTPILASVLALIALIVALHAPVFTRGALITPAGMHYGQWPWKPYGARELQEGALLQSNPTLSDLLFQIYPWQQFAARGFEGHRLGEPAFDRFISLVGRPVGAPFQRGTAARLQQRRNVLRGGLRREAGAA